MNSADCVRRAASRMIPAAVLALFWSGACAPSSAPIAAGVGAPAGAFVFAAGEHGRVDYRRTDSGCMVDGRSYPDRALEEMLDSLRIVLIDERHYDSRMIHRFRCVSASGEATEWHRSTGMVGGRYETDPSTGETVFHESRDPAEHFPLFVGRFTGDRLHLTEPFEITLVRQRNRK
jgi:hypothetical protein